jgi:hypothetical protein
MQANQRRSLPLIEVAMHRVANLLVELVETISLSMNRLTHGVCQATSKTEPLPTPKTEPPRGGLWAR